MTCHSMASIDVPARGSSGRSAVGNDDRSAMSSKIAVEITPDTYSTKARLYSNAVNFFNGIVLFLYPRVYPTSRPDIIKKPSAADTHNRPCPVPHASIEGQRSK